MFGYNAEKLTTLVSGRKYANFIMEDTEKFSEALDTFEEELKKLEEKHSKQMKLRDRIDSLEKRADKLYYFRDEVRVIASRTLGEFIEEPEEGRSSFSGAIMALCEVNRDKLFPKESIDKFAKFIQKLGFLKQSSQELATRILEIVSSFAKKEETAESVITDFIPFLVSHCVKSRVFPKVMPNLFEAIVNKYIPVAREYTDEKFVDEIGNTLKRCFSLLKEVPSLYVKGLPEEETEAGMKQLKEYEEEEKKSIVKLETGDSKIDEKMDTDFRQIIKAYCEGRDKTIDDKTISSSSTE